MEEAVGVRLSEELLEKIEVLSQKEGDDRSTTMRKLIQRGFEEITRERAAQAYREGRVTLSEAAERADLTVWEMEQYLVHHGYRSSYSIEDLSAELDALDSRGIARAGVDARRITRWEEPGLPVSGSRREGAGVPAGRGRRSS